MLRIEIDQQALHEAARRLGAVSGAVTLARSSALRKIRKRIETAIKKQAAKKLRLPQRALGKRFFSDPVRNGDQELKIWIGTYAISPFSLGSPKAYGKPGRSGGVRAGKRRWPGAFLAKIYSSQKKVWIRKSSRHYSPDLYPTKYRPGDRGYIEAGLRGRFPVVRAAVPVDGVISEVVDAYHPEIRAEFGRIFAQELNYYVNVRGR